MVIKRRERERRRRESRRRRSRPLSPQSDNMLLIAREGIREGGEGAKKVSRTSHCRYAALSPVRVPEASRYMRKALRRRRTRRRTTTRTTMRRDEYGRSVRGN